MNILINGDIYIKIKPSVFNPSSEEFETLEDELYNLNFEESKDGGTQLTKEIREILNSIGDILKRKGEEDYSYLENFFVFATDGQNATMKSYDDRLNQEISETFSLHSEQMTEYKRLIEFLNEAEFVGRKIKIYDDYIFPNPIVLYKTDYAMCILEPRTGNIKMLDIRLLDEDLSEKKESVEIYQDKKLLYKTIIHQIIELSKKCDRDDDYRKTK